jgi:WD40 repeat protein
VCTSTDGYIHIF